MAPQAKKKIGYGVKMLVYNHTVTQQTLFLRSKKGKWRRRQKKIKGYGTSASAASENFKVPSFQSSGRSGGPRRGAPKSAQKSPLFFFFFFFFFVPKKSRIMRCRIIRYMELFPWVCFLPVGVMWMDGIGVFIQSNSLYSLDES